MVPLTLRVLPSEVVPVAVKVRGPAAMGPVTGTPSMTRPVAPAGTCQVTDVPVSLMLPVVFIVGSTMLPAAPIRPRTLILGMAPQPATAAGGGAGAGWSGHAANNG